MREVAREIDSFDIHDQYFERYIMKYNAATLAVIAIMQVEMDKKIQRIIDALGL